jgi:hypothetical protein
MSMAVLGTGMHVIQCSGDALHDFRGSLITHALSRYTDCQDHKRYHHYPKSHQLPVGKYNDNVDCELLCPTTLINSLRVQVYPVGE